MPFPFILPTTSAFSFSSSLSSESHPSLPLNASTYRGVLRDALKRHKRLPPASQSSNVPSIISNLSIYLPYLVEVDLGLHPKPGGPHDDVRVESKSPLGIEWRPTLTGQVVPGKENPRTKVHDLQYEVCFVLSTLGMAYTLSARSALHPLYVTSSAPVGSKDRTAAITTATKYLVDAASVYDYIATRAEKIESPPPSADVSPLTLRALSSLAHAEATLLAVLKDDPYPAVVSQDRNEHDKEWMFKAPDIPKVRAHLFARLCLAASEHASKAASLLRAASSQGVGKIHDDLLRYVQDMQHTSRAKACRFFGIDAELGGETGPALGWLAAGLQELGVESKETKKASFGLRKLKKEWSERREDRRVEKFTAWGADAGRLEETRVIEMLEAKWTKLNDTMNTQLVPSPHTLLAQMPGGREIHVLRPYQPPRLDPGELNALRAPPDRPDDYAGAQDLSSDDESGPSRTIGAWPGSEGSYRSSSTTTYY